MRFTSPLYAVYRPMSKLRLGGLVIDPEVSFVALSQLSVPHRRTVLEPRLWICTNGKPLREQTPDQVIESPGLGGVQGAYVSGRRFSLERRLCPPVEAVSRCS
jgi:hypothetical protein